MDESLKIAICEDTESDAQKLLAVIKDCDMQTSCTLFSSGESFLESYEPQKFDLLLTDIYMGGMTGVDIVAKIRETDTELPVAFVTTSTDFALEGYRLSVLKYIEKPFRKKDVLEILKLAWMEKNSAPALIFRQKRNESRIRLSQIIFLEQQVHLLNIYLKNGEDVQIYEKLSAFLPELEENGFFIPHKSFAVNLSCVQYIDTGLKCFVMENGKNVPIRRETMNKAKKAFETLLFSKTRGNLHEKNI